MPKEIHYLLFTREEIADALLEYHAAMHSPSPYGSALDLQLRETATGFTAQMTLVSVFQNRKERRDFDPSEVLSALILFCQNRRIPLARRALKRLEAFGDQIALMTMINIGAAEPKVEGQAVRYSDEDIEEARLRAV